MFTIPNVMRPLGDAAGARAGHRELGQKRTPQFQTQDCQIATGGRRQKPIQHLRRRKGKNKATKKTVSTRSDSVQKSGTGPRPLKAFRKNKSFFFLEWAKAWQAEVNLKLPGSVLPRAIFIAFFPAQLILFLSSEPNTELIFFLRAQNLEAWSDLSKLCKQLRDLLSICYCWKACNSPSHIQVICQTFASYTVCR